MMLVDDKSWNEESLRDCYQKGFFAGMTATAKDKNPFPHEILHAAWEAGWEDGAHQSQQSDEDHLEH